MTVIDLDRSTVATLTTPDSYWDETLKGFGLDVRRAADGAIRRKWLIQYRLNGQQGKYKFADAAKLTVKQARDKAKELLAEITLGRDPQADKKAARAAKQAPPALTLRAAFEKYIEMKDTEMRQGHYRRSSFRVTKLYLLGQRYFGPLHRLDVNAVTRQAVAARLHEIRRTTSDTTAGRARAQLAAAFTR